MKFGRILKLSALVVLALYVAFFAFNHATGRTVGYDFDSTLSFSTPSFIEEEKRRADGENDFNWNLINGELVGLEKPKVISRYVWVFRALGYTPIIITARPEIKRDEFVAHVSTRYGFAPGDIYMTNEKNRILKERKTVIFFGDSNSDITAAQEAGCIAIRILRSADDQYKKSYDPGKYGEFILPFSEAHD